MRHVLVLLALSAACASSGAVAGRRAAHGGFPKASYDATWERALEVLRAEGYEVGLADRQRGILMTTERELQAACGDQQCLSRGSVSLRLGTDDEDDMTSLAGVDLYDDLPGRLAGIRNLKRHPYEFYEKCGFTIVGVVPDANGRGKPDILMAKRI